MCGICGKTGSRDKTDSLVKAMNNAIAHRGPDEQGQYTSDFCSLAMSRLAIIDLKSGSQPIFNEDKTICIFMNGEIYNYPTLRSELIINGHQFTTNSDTEVVLHLYEEKGMETPRYLRGMFTLCIYDLKKNTLFLSRDRFGEKPLYYHHSGGELSFSSEIKSLLEDQSVPRVLNREALEYYLKVSMVPEPLTLFKDIFSLPPGHSMLFGNGKLNIEPYFSINYQVDTNIKSEADAIEYLSPYLNNAVKKQLISDVPIGAFLSGGIDSSTVVALMQQNASRPIKTFTVKFEDSAYDESPIAWEVAKYLGTEHHQIDVPNKDFQEDIFWTMIDHSGLPLADSSAIPTYFISKEIRKHVTVALSGDGGDELFAGYNLFKWWQKLNSFKNIPPPLFGVSSNLLSLTSNIPGLRNSSKIRQAKRVSDILRAPDELRAIELHHILNDVQMRSILKSGTFEYPRLAELPCQSEQWTPLRKLMYYRITHNLPLHMLTKVDRMSMANSLEVRTPFLDPDLFEASSKIPDRLLIKNNTGKYILRKLMKPNLPEIVFDHPKTGFDIPLQKYFNTEFENLTKTLVSDTNPLAELFNLDVINGIMNSSFNQASSNSKHSIYRLTHQAWLFIQLFGWARRFNITLE